MINRECEECGGYELDDGTSDVCYCGREWEEAEDLRQRLKVKEIRIAELTEALKEIASKHGKCIFGTQDMAETATGAFRQGSNFAYDECADIALNALKKG